jgi:tRNA threonylcarbamoyladenosine biosynthesis protein TsaE
MCKFIVNSAEETMELAKKLGLGLQPGSILTLEGDLAAGKTTFTKGLALGLGIVDVIDSPTFAIVKEYEGKLSLFHMDVYRLNGDSDIEFLLEYFDREGVCVIEWASMIEQDLPEDRIEIRIERLDGDGREITIACRSNKLKFDFQGEELI